MSETLCKKIELANGLCMRLCYCQNCQLVELEIGSITLKLSPANIQRMANIMMKASLKLEHINAASKSQAFAQPHLIH